MYSELDLGSVEARVEQAIRDNEIEGRVAAHDASPRGARAAAASWS